MFVNQYGAVMRLFALSVLVSSLTLIGFSQDSFAGKLNYFLDKVVILDEVDAKEMGHQMEQNKKKLNPKKSKRIANCNIIYRNTPIKILDETNKNEIKIKIVDGKCKGVETFVNAMDIKAAY